MPDKSFLDVVCLFTAVLESVENPRKLSQKIYEKWNDYCFDRKGKILQKLKGPTYKTYPYALLQ